MIDAASRALWRIQLLGELRVAPCACDPDDREQDGDEETYSRFRTHKAALLLARLLLYPARSHSRDVLADWLWPDAPADRGRANLSHTLLRLRKQFAVQPGDRAAADCAVTALFVTDHQSVRIASSLFETDVAEFERYMGEARAQCGKGAAVKEQLAHWERALQGYGGDLLPGFYDDWVDSERRRLGEMRLEAQACRDKVLARIGIGDGAQAPPLPSIPGGGALQTAALPLTLTRFFGREAEIQRVTDLLTQTSPVRLVTLVGMGGIGKTRLAVEIARLLLVDSFVLVTFVPLADVTDSAHIGSAILNALRGESDASAREDALQSAARFLNDVRSRGGRLMLILDNLEQLNAGCASIVTALLLQVPTLSILATSRQPIGVAGEREFSIGPLCSSSGMSSRDLEAQPPDMQLFANRARLVRPDFALSAKNADDVRRLCSLLEGVPLALELAAAWARTLAPAQIADRLHKRFDLLTTRGAYRDGDAPERHKSLRAALAWSYDLLPPDLQAFFARLSVFRGGWTADAAQQVTGVSDVSEPLLLLAERSLILAEPSAAGDGTLRYRMLESLREFAAEESERADGGVGHTALLLRHATWFEALSHEGQQMIKLGRGNRSALALLGPERENLRAALRYTLQPVSEASKRDAAEGITGARLAIQSAWLWSLGERSEYLLAATARIAVLPADIALPLHAQIFSLQGSIANHLANYRESRQKLEESLKLWRLLGDERESAAVRVRLGSVLANLGLRAEAIALWTECVAYARGSNIPTMEAAALNNLANWDSDLSRRRGWIGQAVALDRQHAPGSDLLACSLNSMAIIAFEQNDLAATRACLEEAHDLAVGDGGVGMIGVTKMSLAGLFLETGEHLGRAESLLDEACVLFLGTGELVRVAEVALLQFQLAIKRGAADAALGYARESLRVSCDAGLLNAAGFAVARADRVGDLRAAGFAKEADALEGWRV